MKILFIGTVEFSYKALSSLLENEFEVVGLITKKTSKFNADFHDLTPLAKQYGVPVKYRTKDNEEELISFIKEKSPDVIYCFGWSHILSNTILTLPPYGVVGFHPAELPNNRGRHPIIWALFLGVKQTASTFFIMDEGADTGDIISQEIIKIENDDATTLYQKITRKALHQIVTFSEDLQKNKGNISKIVQDKNEGNTWRKRGKSDGKIDFRMTSKAIVNLVRSLTRPYVGAHIEYGTEDVIVWRVENETTIFDNYEPGKVLEADEKNGIVVKTYDGAIRIIEHEFKILPIKGDYL
ncbi:formyltransferase family protein [Tenacibaculum amylolyticum]|uniref:formyltransferase family protein n=1 Tax=Tenacibaculum amylolyticum TaxID=104269 RepID=UPI0038B66A6C